MGHFPVCGWLRVATAVIKHQASAVTKSWDNKVRDAYLCQVLVETMTRVHEMDPVGGDWCMDDNEMKVWVDVSSLATGMALETNGSIIEDACWLHLTNDARHINLAELDAALKGINLVFQWQATVLYLVTNSAYMHRWISDTLIGKAHVKTKAAGEMLGNTAGIERRLWIDHRCSTSEILSKPCRLSHQSATKVVGSTQGGRRTSTGELHHNEEPTE